MTGRPGYRTMEMIRGSSVRYLACTPCVPLFCTLFTGGGNRRASRLPGEGGDHFHCAVEPSPGHLWCRELNLNNVCISAATVMVEVRESRAHVSAERDYGGFFW